MGTSSHLRTVLIVALLGGGAATGACATVPQPSERLEARRLAVLERDFAAFTATRLDRGDALIGIDDAIADLERLRLEYLDVLEHAQDDDARVAAMVRIAELHLDLGARIRRIPYPQLASVLEQRAFDERLSAQAMPLEAVGIGVLAQAEETALRKGVDSRFARRARLYLALHESTGSDARDLSRDDVETLKKELAARGVYAAPRSLLEAGRIGQRAARR